MARSYDRVLPYGFRRFSILSAFRTALPTLQYHLSPRALPKSTKPALFTMNILPPMMTVWHHLAKKYLGDRVDITIFDCSGKLDPALCPGSNVQKYLNRYAAAKSQEFIEHIAPKRDIAWICDDDMFFIGDALSVLQKEMAIPKTASVSFRPRTWWHFEIEGKQYEPSGSYCLALNREIFVEKEHLHFKQADGNTHPSHIGKVPGRYDTFDKANETLLEKGYRCAIVPKAEREKCITGFSGMSGGVILLSYFKTPDALLDFYTTPPKEQWSGNVLYGTLCSLLAICTIQELHEKITGKPYSLPALPSRSALEKLRKDHLQYLRNDQSFDWVDEASEKLRSHL